MVVLYVLSHVLGASCKFDNGIALLYVQQYQRQFGSLSFAHTDWGASTDLISLWYLGQRCTQFHVCPPCSWEKVLFLWGTLALSSMLSRKQVYRYRQPYQYTVQPFKHTCKSQNTCIIHQLYLKLSRLIPLTVSWLYIAGSSTVQQQRRSGQGTHYVR